MCTLTHAHARAHARSRACTRTQTYVHACRCTFMAIYSSKSAVLEDQLCQTDGFKVYDTTTKCACACVRACGYYHTSGTIILRNSNHNEAKTLIVL